QAVCCSTPWHDPPGRKPRPRRHVTQRECPKVAEAVRDVLAAENHHLPAHRIVSGGVAPSAVRRGPLKLHMVPGGNARQRQGPSVAIRLIDATKVESAEENHRVMERV